VLSEAVPHVVPICNGLLTEFLPEDKGPYASYTPNTVELIPTLGALFPLRRARPRPGPHTLRELKDAWVAGRDLMGAARQIPRLLLPAGQTGQILVKLVKIWSNSGRST